MPRPAGSAKHVAPSFSDAELCSKSDARIKYVSRKTTPPSFCFAGAWLIYSGRISVLLSALGFVASTVVSMEMLIYRINTQMAFFDLKKNKSGLM